MRCSIISTCLFLCAFVSSGLSAAIPTTTAKKVTPVGALLKDRIHEEVNPRNRGSVEGSIVASVIPPMPPQA